ncbi:MAG: HD domain-containing protein [Flavobacteriales bacterium]|nr:HD domain-containing protein [Flavobacteriales bacterium]
MSIITESKEHVKNLFSKADEKKLTYHNFEHTIHVLNAVQLIVENTLSVSSIQKEQLQLAALFHDAAYPESNENHEVKSTEIATKFLSSKKYEEEGIIAINQLILSTQMGYTASNLLEEIISDADLSHLGRDNYMDTTFKDLAEEVRNLKGIELSDGDWAKNCFEFLSKHQYYTSFAKQEFGKNKQDNLEKIEKLIQEKKPKQKKAKKKKKPIKADAPLKGVETMFRVALRNHLSLSQIADNKANTLISVNAIIISIVLSALFPKLDSNPYLFYPGISILLFTIVTIILSILSTIPNVNRGVITRNEVLAKKGNLLFFGNFFKMELDDFEWGMRELMNDKDYLYGTLSRDLYFLGKVLNKKYMLLRYAYYSFVLGLVGSIIIFIASISAIIHSW